MAVTSSVVNGFPSGGRDRDGYSTYTVQYRVFTNSRSDGPKTVMDYASLPDVGDTYSAGNDSDTSCVFVSKSPKYQAEEDTKQVWLVDVVFSNKPNDTQRDPTDPPGDPLTEPWVVETISSKGRKAILFDLDGRLIASSTGEPYDPVTEIDDTRYLIRMNHNQSEVDPGLYAFYRDAVNSDAFFGLGPHYCKIETPGAIKKLYRQVDSDPYYNVTWEISVNAERWRLQLLNYGMYKIVGGTYDADLKRVVGGKRVTLKDANGHELTSPALLALDGSVLNVGANPVILDPFKVYRELPFSVLGLPNSF